MYIFGRDVLLKIEGYNYRNGEPTDFRDPVTFFVNIVYPNTRPFLNSDAKRKLSGGQLHCYFCRQEIRKF